MCPAEIHTPNFRSKSPSPPRAPAVMRYMGRWENLARFGKNAVATFIRHQVLIAALRSESLRLKCCNMPRLPMPFSCFAIVDITAWNATDMYRLHVFFYLVLFGIWCCHSFSLLIACENFMHKFDVTSCSILWLTESSGRQTLSHWRHWQMLGDVK